MNESEILPLVKKHEEMRKNGINLIASENHLSKRVREILSTDLAGRYGSDYYGGSKYAQQILERTKELACELFGVKHALVKPIAGNICDLDVLFSFSQPGDNVAMLPYAGGGYPLGLEKFNRKRISLPYNDDTYQIDIERSEKLYRDEDVALTILGSSYIPFPHPVKEFREYIDENNSDSNLVFDGSHVLGLIATGQFQDPLKEGAEVLIGSTHKTFYGPQGGIILTDSDEYAEIMSQYLEIDLDTGIGLVDNPHVNRIAALGIALEEMMDDEDYGERIVKNSKALAGALDDLGVPMKFKERGYTGSHQIFIDEGWDLAGKLCSELEKQGIFIDRTGRIGTGEVTHRGMGPEDMEDIAEKISEVYHRLK
ncbi:MAG: serine hydroxymethyltransferase [Thermoplasmatota archaeon]